MGDDSLIGSNIGGYDIQRLLGQGGMATVYLAQQRSMNNRPVAIKFLSVDFTTVADYRKRFEREVGIVSQLEHRHIVPVYDHGEYNNQPYIVMRYMSGGSVDDLLHVRGVLDAETILNLFRQIAPALDYAHSKEVLHRDLKPSNILLDDTGGAFLSDFGIARMASIGTTLTTQGVVGTPSHMSPEQALGKPLDARSDIYALGVILFEMTTGQRPFDSETPYSVAVMHVTTAPPSPRDINPDISQDVEDVILTALSKNPDDRYSSAAELLDHLEQAFWFSQHSLMNLEDGDALSPNIKPPTYPSRRMASSDAPKTTSPYPRAGAPPPLTPAPFTQTPSDSVPLPLFAEQDSPSADKSKGSTNRGLIVFMALLVIAVMGLSAILMFLNLTNDTSSTALNVTPSATLTDTALPTDTLDLTPLPNVEATNAASDARATTIAETATAFELTRSSPTITIAPTLTDTITPSATLTETLVPTQTDVVNPVVIPTDTPTITPSPTATHTATATHTNTPTITPDWDATSIARARAIETSIASTLVAISATPTPTSTSTAQPTPNGGGSGLIAFIRQSGEDYRLYTMTVDGFRLRNISGGLDSREATWSSDGRRLAFHSKRGDAFEIYLINADGSNPLNITRTVDVWEFAPAWSPDDSRIAFMSTRDSNWDIYSMNPDGSDIFNLTESETENWSPNWSPDGSKIVFASGGVGIYNIFVMDADGSNVTNLTRHDSLNAVPRWSPDGRFITFFSDRDGNRDIYLMRADGNGLTNLTKSSVSDDENAAWSPDGTQLLFHSNRDGNFEIYAMNPDGSNVRRLTYSIEDDYNPIWQPALSAP